MKRTFWHLACVALLLPALALGGCGRQAAEPEPAADPTDAPATGAEAAPTNTPAEEAAADGGNALLFAVNVGKGDALILRAGGWTGLIDAGKARSCGRVRAALRLLGVTRLDAVFLTHTDDDHAGGLEWLARSEIEIGGWYASAMYTGVKAEKHPAVKAAALRGQDVTWLRRGDRVPMGEGGAALDVLAPASLYNDKDDNNSLVMLLSCDGGRMLLTGDMELPEEAELLSFGDDLKCDILKVPNHGDDDTTSAAFAKAAGAKLAVISTDAGEKPGTPDAGVVSRLEAAGSRVAVTEDAGLGLRATLSGGEAGVETTPIDAPEVSGLRIAAVDADDDRITLRNDSGAAIALDGFSLHSDRGEELFLFPDGAAIAAGAELTVGTRSTDGAYDLLWDDKKVINKKKVDAIDLFDAFGRLVDENYG